MDVFDKKMNKFSMVFDYIVKTGKHSVYSENLGEQWSIRFDESLCFARLYPKSNNIKRDIKTIVLSNSSSCWTVVNSIGSNRIPHDYKELFNDVKKYKWMYLIKNE